MEKDSETNHSPIIWPAISVLICSRDRRDMLDQVVEGIRSQKYPGDIDIVIVEETDNPRPIPGTIYHPIPVRNLGFGHARNISLSLARHEIVVFIDDDAFPLENWLQQLIGHFSNPNIQGVAGAIALPPSNIIGGAEYILGFPGGGLKYLHQSGGKPQPTRTISTVNAAYRKKAIELAGGFEEKAVFGSEDQRLSNSICKASSCIFEPRAQVEHLPRGSFRDVAKWFRRRGIASVIPNPTMGWMAMLRALFLPKIIVFAAAGLLIAGLLGAVIGALFHLVAVSLAALWRHRFALGYSQMDVGSWLMIVPVKLVMDLYIDIGTIEGLILRKGSSYSRR